MDTQLLIPGIIFGLSIGSIFFLLAIGLSLCFGLLLIFIMLAGEKGIWGTLEPILKKALSPKSRLPREQESGDRRR